MKKYNVIYADPPWDYNNKKTGGSMVSGAKSKYKTMSLEEICGMPIQDITDENSVLFLWTTVPLLDEGMQVLKAWGFKYKTMITWEKTGTYGMGHWLRVQTEHILIGVKGFVVPFRHNEKNIYQHPICEHSAKPHFFRELVMTLSDRSFTEKTRLELFARSRSGFFPDYEYEGWDVYGNQVNNSIKI